MRNVLTSATAFVNDVANRNVVCTAGGAVVGVGVGLLAFKVAGICALGLAGKAVVGVAAAGLSGYKAHAFMDDAYDDAIINAAVAQHNS